MKRVWVEKLFVNELTRKRVNRFLEFKTAILALIVLGMLGFLSLTAEFWANSRPILMKYNGSWYVPVLRTYHPSVFGQDGFVTDYRAITSPEFRLDPLIEWDPLERDASLEELPAKPSGSHWFGTDENGRDVAARLLYGLRSGLSYSILVWLFASAFGIGLGGIMGYFAGLVDLLGQRLIEIWESMPTLMLLIILASMMHPNIYVLAVFTVLFGWTTVSLYIRAEFLKLRKREFVEAAVALGASNTRVIFRHILPNSLVPWLTLSPFMVAGSISGLATLDYLGYGLPAPTPSWGELLGQAQKHFQVAWWLAVYPSLALFLTLTSLNLIGRAMRDALDPRR